MSFFRKMLGIFVLAIILISGGSSSLFATEPMLNFPPTPTNTDVLTADWYYSPQSFEGNGMACFNCHSSGGERPYSRRILKARAAVLENQVRLCIEASYRVNGKVQSDEQIEMIVATLRQIYGLKQP